MQPELTPTAAIVLGLVELAGEATPYDLKQAMGVSVGNFWSVPHSQVYAEAERLARTGLLAERREPSGRRRRLYSVTDAGREALAAWRTTPAAELPQLRDPALLKLFFGADPATLARERLEAHREKLRRYEELAAADDGSGPFLALRAGIGHEREWVRYWEELARGQRRRERGSGGAEP